MGNSRSSDQEILDILGQLRVQRRELEDFLRRSEHLLNVTSRNLIETGLNLGASIVFEQLIGGLVSGALPMNQRRYVAGLLKKFSEDYGDNALTKRIFAPPPEASPADDGDPKGQE